MIKSKACKNNILSTSISEYATVSSYYVIAIHDYLPSSTDKMDESASCLFFKKGSIIEVLNKDESGWWDGQCGNRRGWFPSNYTSSDEWIHQNANSRISTATQDWNQKMCFNYNVSQDNYCMKINLPKHEKRRSTDTCTTIEIASRRVMDLVDACNNPNQHDLHHYSSRIVSSIKSILIEFNLINKDSYLLRVYPELARQRKIILTALNRLITKSKELQYNENTEDKKREQKQISILANELMDAINYLAKIIFTPRKSTSSATDSTIKSQRASSSFDTPRSSTSSVGDSTAPSGSTNMSVQHMAETHPTTIKKPRCSTDNKGTLQKIMTCQSNINEWIEKLRIELGNYLEHQSHATVILDITRKVMEFVMSFLSVAENICSGITELDDSRRAFMIPKNPSHAALIITKESVYSTITNLVTAIRILTEPSHQNIRVDSNHLYSCCEDVSKATKECTLNIKSCLFAKIEEKYLPPNMQELPEKDTSELLNIANHPDTSQHINKQRETLPDQAFKQPCTDIDIDPHKETKTNASDVCEKSSMSSSKDSFPASCHSSFSSMSSISTPNSVLYTDTNLPDATSMKGVRSRRSTNASFLHLPLAPKESKEAKTSFVLPHVDQNVIKPTPQPLKSRLSRGLSVSSLRSTFSRSKLERLNNLSEALPDVKLPSWMSMHTSVMKPEKNSSAHVDISAPFISDQIESLKNEPDYLILKKFAFKEDDMILNAEGEVVGATIEALVQRLTLQEKSLDPKFIQTFFYTFRLFSNPQEFLKLLIARYHLQPPANISEVQSVLWSNRIMISIRFRVYHIIKTWLENYYDQEQDIAIKEQLTEFVSNDMSQTMPGPAKRLIDLVAKTFYIKSGISYSNANLQTVSTNMYHSISKGVFSNLGKFDDFNETAVDKYPQPIFGKGLRHAFKKNTNITSIHVCRFHSVELARQLTLLENRLFCQIQVNELIGQEFKKKAGQSQALHVKAMIQISTQITGWVSDTILKEKDVKKRSNVLKHWIKVGYACLQFDNYNTLMAIRSALDSASIIRLKKTWDYLSLKHRCMWENIHKVTDSQRNFTEYRQRLRVATAPCLPFLGIYLTDMTFIDDGNPGCRDSPSGKQLINFNKYVKMAKVLSEVRHFQIPYKFIEVDEIQCYIRKTLQKVEQDDQLFYSRSLKREPKEEECLA